MLNGIESTKLELKKSFFPRRNLDLSRKIVGNADILNVYWYSKSEFEMIEEINACLEQSGSLTNKLEL